MCLVDVATDVEARPDAPEGTTQILTSQIQVVGGGSIAVSMGGSVCEEDVCV
jgi:hypothetical protein